MKTAEKLESAVESLNVTSSDQDTATIARLDARGNKNNERFQNHSRDGDIDARGFHQEGAGGDEVKERNASRLPTRCLESRLLYHGLVIGAADVSSTSTAWDVL